VHFIPVLFPGFSFLSPHFPSITSCVSCEVRTEPLYIIKEKLGLMSMYTECSFISPAIPLRHRRLYLTIKYTEIMKMYVRTQFIQSSSNCGPGTPRLSKQLARRYHTPKSSFVNFHQELLSMGILIIFNPIEIGF
jgi:hypothetical protein